MLAKISGGKGVVLGSGLVKAGSILISLGGITVVVENSVVVNAELAPKKDGRFLNVEKGRKLH